MTKNEIQTVLSHMNGKHKVMVGLLYGGGVRLMECIRLRVKDLDFARNPIYIIGTKGDKDRLTLFRLKSGWMQSLTRCQNS